MFLSPLDVSDLFLSVLDVSTQAIQAIQVGGLAYISSACTKHFGQEATTQGDLVFVSGPAGCEHTGDQSHSGGGTGIGFKAHALSTLGSM